MYQQTVKGKPITAIQGVGLIVLIVASIYLCDLLVTWIGTRTGFAYGSIAVWLVIGVEAICVARQTVMSFRYTLADGQLHIERLFGQSSRIVLSINTADIREIGSEAELRARYPEAKLERLTLKDTTPSPTALAFRPDAATRLLLFQPNEEFIARLKEQRGLRVE